MWSSGLLCQAVPDFMSAAGCGLLVPIVLAEPADAAGRQRIDVIEPLTGGTGASKGVDGVDARETSVSGMSNNPVEAVESSAAVRIIRYGIRTDSGGPGQWRGGAGFELTFAPTRDRCQVLGRGVERFRFAPWGLAGGRCAERARIVLNLGRPDEKDLGKIDVVDVRLGQTVTILTPGGGGYGDPLDREPALVHDDVRRGIVSVERALPDYGVVLSAGEVDAEVRRGNGSAEKLRHPNGPLPRCSTSASSASSGTARSTATSFARKMPPSRASHHRCGQRRAITGTPH